MRLADKAIIVTGGAMGIGRAYCLGLAKEGGRVVVADLREQEAKNVASEIRGNGGEAMAVAVDVTSPEKTCAMAEAAVSAYGRIDVLVNNAGMYTGIKKKSFAEIPPEEWDKVMAVNLKGPFRLSALFASRMIAGDGGSIVNISSTASIRPNPETAPYGAAKAGLNILTVACAKEYGPKVRVNCIICGPFHTDISKGWSRTEDFTKRARETFPLQRGGEPHEVVGAALYFASPLASFTTGTTLTIDGGSSQPLVRTLYE